MKALMTILSKKSGRSHGKVTVRHQGGRQKRYLRRIDFRRDKDDVQGSIEAIEFDPNRNARIARVLYEDGERRYMIAPLALTIGQKVLSGEAAPLEIGNTLPLGKIAVGTSVHNIEIMPGKGGQIVKSAGSYAVVHGKEETHVLVKLPSGEIRRFDPESRATVGQVGNPEARSRNFRKAGTRIRLGIRPTVRGVAQNPNSHPHGGGEGRSGVGMKHPKTPWGKSAVGNTRSRKKYSDKLIVSRRKLGKHH